MGLGIQQGLVMKIYSVSFVRGSCNLIFIAALMLLIKTYIFNSPIEKSAYLIFIMTIYFAYQVYSYKIIIASNKLYQVMPMGFSTEQNSIDLNSSYKVLHTLFSLKIVNNNHTIYISRLLFSKETMSNIVQCLPIKQD
mgnify:CR=1 FL=1